MRRASLLRVFGLLSVVTGLAVGQSTPSFVGTWVRVDPGATAQEAPQQVIVREASSERRTALVVERRFDTEVRAEQYDVGIIGGTVGGEVRGVPGGDLTRTSVSVRRYGNTLVIQSGSYTGPTSWETREFSEREEVWTLEENGTLTIAITIRRTGAKPTMTKATYRRK